MVAETKAVQGHCRRRKIRCIPSPADVQGRCVNCIRLKKECSFYPVDQPPTPDARQKQPGSRSSVGPKMSSASSSPAMAPGLPSDMPGQQAQYPQMAMGNVQAMGAPSGKPSQSDSYPPDAKSEFSETSCSQDPVISKQPWTDDKQCRPAFRREDRSITIRPA
jgi:hypothetical protein